MDDLMQQILQQQQLFLQQQQHYQRTYSALQNIERQISHLATNMDQMQAQAEQDDSHFAPISAQNIEKEAQQQGIEVSVPLPFPQRRFQQRKNVEEEKAREFQELMNLFSKVEVNVPLLTMIEQVPKYAKFLKDVCLHKKKLMGNELVSMGKYVSALIQPIPQKCDDPGVFTVPCTIGNYVFEDDMLDLGASINVMSKLVFLSLGIDPLQPTGVVIQLANRSQAHPTGVIENVLVKMSDLIFPADFYILDMEGDVLMNRAPIILGRPFLKTARTKIDVHAGTLSMEIADVVVQFSIFDTLQQKKRHSIFSVYKSEWLDTMDFLIDEDSDEVISDSNELGCKSKHSGGCIDNREIVEILWQILKLYQGLHDENFASLTAAVWKMKLENRNAVLKTERQNDETLMQNSGSAGLCIKMYQRSRTSLKSEFL
ncbi:uncharacterized protein LOC122004263 [Zingiber officinale]|uniref:uncharacterized protein LOC122004263 n=1 Tax=Zingiber officinale TaxID=94328 RepID=UPI001C4B2B7D|nr:uncharacterized protein LOC122004263 [Zingiber officinale]